jgi:N-methylhydantoinase B
VKLDPLRMEVIKNSLISVTEEMSATLHRSAYSTNIKTRKDYSCALFDSRMRLIAQAFAQPGHLGVIWRLVPAAVGRQEKIADEDVIIVNDPYSGAGHLNDIALITPIFYRDELFGYVANMAHHVDVGGGAPASFYISKELYQEGIIIPPLKLYSQGNFNQPLFDLLVRNVRAKREVPGDLRAQVAANNIGKVRAKELLDRYGVESLNSYIETLLDYTEERTLQAFRDLPHGTFTAEDFMDDDGFSDQPIRIKASISIDESGIVCDFSGTDLQRKSPMNGTIAFAYTAASFVLKCLISDDIPVNDGFYRCIKLRAPEGTVLNCIEPSGVVGGYETAQRVIGVLFQAFSKVIPERIAAGTKGNVGHLGFGGYDSQKKESYAFLETLGGGSGGRLGKDGMEGVQCDISNTENAPVEEMEIGYPVRILRYELIPDSGGAGHWRGGLGMRRDYRFTAPETTVTIFSDRAKFPPWGLFGGKNGALARFFKNPDSPASEPLRSKCILEVGPDDVISLQTPGGGGYGNPHERDANSVRLDVIRGKVSAKSAEQDYGVLFNEKGEIDQQRTEKLRRSGKTGA